MNASNERWSGQRRFRRLTLRQRGHFPNTLRIKPVTDILLFDQGIALIKGGRQYRYRWADIRRASILSEERFKGYGWAASGRFIRRTFILETVDERRYLFDVSEDFPDFEKNRDLLTAISERISVTKSAVRTFNYTIWIVFATLIVLAGIVAKKFGI